MRDKFIFTRAETKFNSSTYTRGDVRKCHFDVLPFRFILFTSHFAKFTDYDAVVSTENSYTMITVYV